MFPILPQFVIGCLLKSLAVCILLGSGIITARVMQTNQSEAEILKLF